MSLNTIKRLLQLPEDYDMRGASYDTQTDQIYITVEHESIPGVRDHLVTITPAYHQAQEIEYGTIIDHLNVRRERRR